MGEIARSVQSDFDEVDGLFFPFHLGQGLKGGPMQPITVESIVVNPEVDESLFSFPDDDY